MFARPQLRGTKRSHVSTGYGGTRRRFGSYGVRKFSVRSTRGKRGTRGNRRRGRPSLQAQINDVRRLARAGVASHTRKSRTAGAQTVGECVAAYFQVGLSVTALESEFDALRYYDPAVPGTLVTAAAGTGTYSRTLSVKSIYHSLLLRNGYTVPLKLNIHAMVPKRDTSITPSTALSNGSSDQLIDAISTAPTIYLSDIDQVG